MHEHSKIFSNHPEHADKKAQSLLKEQGNDMSRNQRNSFWTNLIAARLAPGSHASSRYGYRAAASIDFPYFTTLFLGVGWCAVIIFQGWPTSWFMPGAIIIFILMYIKSRFI